MKMKPVKWEKIFARKKKKNPNTLILKWAKGISGHFHRRCADGYQVYEKVFTVINHQKNGNQNQK